MDYLPTKGEIEDTFQKVYSHFAYQSRYVLKKNIEFQYRNEIPNLLFYTDFLILKRILDNLLSNAFKFTETGMVEFGGKQNDSNSILFWIKDTGIGISKEELPIIFSRFRQADGSETRKYDGTGIGLTISKACVEMLGGNLWVESEIGKGSTFYFNIPVNKL